MLNPNEIPSKEPLLRVGIILPEDKFKLIRIEIPDGIDYKIENSDAGIENINQKNLTFSAIKDSIGLYEYGNSKSWKISPAKYYKIAPQSGVKIIDVVAGRGFHWQKHIDVFLSGSIEIALVDGNLILTNELPIEKYLMCVATSEMSAECPAALIESQTIAARSWMLANVEQKHVAIGMDVCNDDCCQRYQGTTYLSEQSISGAMKTFGQVLLFEDKICDARYSKSCGGAMETFSTIWAGNNLPYMQNKFDYFDKKETELLPLNTNEKTKDWINSNPDSFCSPKTIAEESLPKYLGNVDKEGTYYRWQFQYSQLEITTLLNKQLNLNAKNILSLQALDRGGSGRIINLEIKYQNNNNEVKSYIVERDVEIRRVLHENFMYSSCIDIEACEIKNNVPGVFKIKGAGWGHGAGYCQIGALGMSLMGYSTEEIVYHYFPGSQLKKIY
jgi:peptidoglycan hydrolase-like amidase